MAKVSYRYVQAFVDQRGKQRIYYRRKGFKSTPLRGPLGGPEFWQDYHAAVCKGSQTASIAVQRTFRWLCQRYLESVDFRQLDPSTQRSRQLILEHAWNEPATGNPHLHIGDYPVTQIDTKFVRLLRDRKVDFPSAANGRVKTLRRVFSWAMENDLITANFAREIQYLRTRTTGFHPWTPDEIQAFECCWPIGTKERLAFALLRHLGVRRSDVVQLGKQHLRNSWLRFTTKKGGVRLELPLTPKLQRIIEASPCGELNFLTTEYGKPYSANGFGNWFRSRCNTAGLPHCSAHGLRKAAAISLAEAGASAHQLMAWFGWRSIAEAERYTRAASRRVLAASAATLLISTEDRM